MQNFPLLGDENALVGTSIVQDCSTYKMTFKLKSAAKKALRYCQLQYQRQWGGESTLSLSTENTKDDVMLGVVHILRNHGWGGESLQMITVLHRGGVWPNDYSIT